MSKKKNYRVFNNYNISYNDAMLITRKIVLKRGNVVWIDFGFNIGNEFGGIHPAIILKNLGDDLFVLPVSSKKPMEYAIIDKEFEDRTVEDWKNTLDVNLIAPFLLTKIVGKEMMKQKKGSIINISSTNGINTYYPSSVDYDASKSGLISLTYDSAVQYSPYVRVNCIAPGWVNTEMNKELEEDFIKSETEKILVKRFGEPEEIANVVVFLASDEASFINSAVIKVDGGWY